MTPATILSKIDANLEGARIVGDARLELWERFGLSIREARKKRDIGLSEFALKLKRTPAMIALMETGKRAWPMPLAKKAVEIVA